ncbi:related to amidase (acetamidase) [Armillaria ostoyae]|uniref:Related to amidase (Acetamidase) n=1 Tax=Armillaria ostoyae TaxID=47428 RepID=A0A284RRU9_ARMOS|nr:related to amidase (acetamidase) [Armillaria ostoyae]
MGSLHRACAWKRDDRQRKIDALPVTYKEPLTPAEEKIHALPLATLVTQCRSGLLNPADVMQAYAKKMLVAQKESNCITDIMVNHALESPSLAHCGPGADSDTRAEDSRPLLGVPVSVKDSFDIEGHDTTIGLARFSNKPAQTSAPIVRLLRDAGALIHVKTTVPTALFSMETESDLFGRTTNPYKATHGVGASTGGGGALVAWGGSMVEVGSDVAGSVRIPAHTCGIWSMKGSVGRFPVLGNMSPMTGLEAVPILTGPLANSLDNLEEFYKRVIDMEPWTYDHTCVPLQWRPLDLLEEGRKLKWGVIWSDDTIPPTPACKRALSTVVGALKADGHEVVDFSPPIEEVLGVGYQIVFADGGRQIRNVLLPGETLNAALVSVLKHVSRSRFGRTIRRLWSFITGNSEVEYPDILKEKNIVEERQLIVQRDELRQQWHDKWQNEGLDFVLTVTFPFPALENGDGEKASLMSASYTFLFNLLDYSAGVLPVTNVRKDLDSLPVDFQSTSMYQSLSAPARQAWSTYDAEKMDGLPLSVQVVGRRFEEEKVFAGMRVIEAALKKKNVLFIGKKDAV